MSQTKKTLAFFVVILFLCLACSVSAAITTNSSVSKTVSAGTNITDILKITNTGNSTINITFSGKTLSNGIATLNIDIDNITNLENGSTVNIPFNITVPVSQTIGTYTGNLTLNYDSNTKDIPFTITVTSAPEFTISSTNITLIGDYGRNSTASFTLSKVSSNVYGLNINYDAADFRDDDNEEIKLYFSPSSNINITNTTTIDLVAVTPLKMDYGVYSGLVNISNEDTLESINVTVILDSILVIKKIKVTSEGRDNEVIPGEEINVEVTVENKYDEDADNDLELDLDDVEITVTIMDGNSPLEDDDDDELEDTSSTFSLRAGKDTTRTLTFQMPWSKLSDDDKYTIKVEVEGDNNDDSTQEFYDKDESEYITVDLPAHALHVEGGGKLFPTVVSCDRQTTLTFEIQNVGRNEEDVRVTAWSPELGLNFVDSFELDNDLTSRRSRKTVSIPIDASNVALGDYQINSKIRYDNNKKVISNAFKLTVEECKTDKKDSDSDTDTENGDNNMSTEETTWDTESESTDTTETGLSQTSFTNSIWFILVMVIGIVIVFGLIVFLIMYMIMAK
ncbi:hypothetical protein DRJ17_02935 [Candidatus Woesearchaeota archaeon]|nr:MAG: hypothetical protein DRJ17_02935 [Candidatus Woesearchaeota archaeon]